MKLGRLLFSMVSGATLLVASGRSARAEGVYAVSREVSNAATPDVVRGFARYVDVNLDMPWGLARTPDPCSLFAALACQPEGLPLLWVANHDSRVLTVYDEQGAARLNGGQALTVMVAGAPTGLVYNPSCEPTQETPEATWGGLRSVTRCDAASPTPTGDFDVSAGGAFAPSFLLVAARDGKVYGWNPAVDVENAQVIRDDSAAGADYLGLALDPTGSAIYLADFANGRVVAYDGRWTPKSFRDDDGVAHPWLADPSIPSGFAPSNVAFVADRLVVTYGKQGAAGAAYETVGPSFPGALYSGPHGYVVAFTLREDGTYDVQRLDAPESALDAPWGIVQVPAGFGEAEPLLYVGNFGDGYINAFDPTTLEYRGRVGSVSTTANPVRLPGLRGLVLESLVEPGATVGAGGDGGAAGRLFYNADLRYDSGPDVDAWSVFGFITAR